MQTLVLTLPQSGDSIALCDQIVTQLANISLPALLRVQDPVYMEVPNPVPICHRAIAILLVLFLPSVACAVPSFSWHLWMSDLMYVTLAGICALSNLLSLPSHECVTQWVCMILCIRKFQRQLQHTAELVWSPFVCLS